MIRRPPRPTLFPTRRSSDLLGLKGQMSEAEKYWMRLRMHGAKLSRARRGELPLFAPTRYAWDHGAGCLVRSEEHTSELQSRLHLVCRLLLEKKTNTTSLISI